MTRSTTISPEPNTSTTSFFGYGKILNATKLEETVKWGGPCYTHGGKNIVGMGAFKSYCGLWFYQGALLSDPDKVLINAQQGRTKALRQWRFQAGDKIPVGRIKSYVAEAIRLSSAGNEIKPDRSRPLAIPARTDVRTGRERQGEIGLCGAYQRKAARIRRIHRRRKASGNEAETLGEDPSHDCRGTGIERSLSQIVARTDETSSCPLPGALAAGRKPNAFERPRRGQLLASRRQVPTATRRRFSSRDRFPAW